MKKKTLFIIIALLAIGVAGGRTVKTTRKIPTKKISTEWHSKILLDTIIPCTGEIELSGYDKTLRARQETMFVTNNTLHHIVEMVVTTQYLDLEGRELHQRTVHIGVDLPSGATRKADFPTWDRQQSFYYKDSRRPRSSATPYTIRQRVDTIFALPTASNA